MGEVEVRRAVASWSLLRQVKIGSTVFRGVMLAASAASQAGAGRRYSPW